MIGRAEPQCCSEVFRYEAFFPFCGGLCPRTISEGYLADDSPSLEQKQRGEGEAVDTGVLLRRWTSTDGPKLILLQ